MTTLPPESQSAASCNPPILLPRNQVHHMAPTSQNEVRAGNIGKVPLFLAAVEVVELFIWLMFETKLKSQSLFVRLKTMGAGKGPKNMDWFHLRVRCPELRNINVNIEQYLMLYGTGLMRVLGEMQRHFEGRFMWFEEPNSTPNTVKYNWISTTVTSFDTSLELKESKSIGISFGFKFFQDKEFIVAETKKLDEYLHKLKIANPALYLTYYINIQGQISTHDYKYSGYRSSFGSRKIAADVQHYVLKEFSSEDNTRIYLKSSPVHQLGSIRVDRNRYETLRMSIIAALAPPTPEGQLVPNDLCTQLRVLFFGPGFIPLFLSGGDGQIGLCPDTLIKLEDYNLKIGEQLNKVTSPGVVQPDWSYSLEVVDPADSISSQEETEDEKPTHTILLIAVLDQLQVEDRDVIENCALLDSLRQNFVQIMCKYRLKVRKVVTSAMNKIIHNYTTLDQKQELFQTAVATISSSIFDVVSHSTNNVFRQKCCSMLQSTDSRSLKTSTIHHLCKFVKKKHGVTLKEKSLERSAHHYTKSSKRKQGQDQENSLHGSQPKKVSDNPNGTLEMDQSNTTSQIGASQSNASFHSQGSSVNQLESSHILTRVNSHQSGTGFDLEQTEGSQCTVDNLLSDPCLGQKMLPPNREWHASSDLHNKVSECLSQQENEPVAIVSPASLQEDCTNRGCDSYTRDDSFDLLGLEDLLGGEGSMFSDNGRGIEDIEAAEQKIPFVNQMLNRIMETTTHGKVHEPSITTTDTQNEDNSALNEPSNNNEEDWFSSLIWDI